MDGESERRGWLFERAPPPFLLFSYLDARVRTCPQQFRDFGRVVLSGRHEEEEVARGEADYG